MLHKLLKHEQTVLGHPLIEVDNLPTNPAFEREKFGWVDIFEWLDDLQLEPQPGSFLLAGFDLLRQALDHAEVSPFMQHRGWFDVVNGSVEDVFEVGRHWVRILLVCNGCVWVGFGNGLSWFGSGLGSFPFE